MFSTLLKSSIILALPDDLFTHKSTVAIQLLEISTNQISDCQIDNSRSVRIFKDITNATHVIHTTNSTEEKLAKLRRHASRVHFAKIHFG